MVKLYELTERYRVIEGMFESDLVTKEEVQTSLDDIKEQIDDKVENIAKIVLSFKANIEAIKAEEERLANRRSGMISSMEWLKNYLLNAMMSSRTYKVKRDLLTVSVTDNLPSVEVIDLDMIPAEYRRVIPETWQPDKKAIVEHFKETGEIIPGTDVILNKKHVRARRLQLD